MVTSLKIAPVKMVPRTYWLSPKNDKRGVINEAGEDELLAVADFFWYFVAIICFFLHINFTAIFEALDVLCFLALNDTNFNHQHVSPSIPRGTKCFEIPLGW